MTPEQIAAGLTRAQREALMGRKVSGSAKPSLVRLGLLDLVPKQQAPWAKQDRYEHHATPLGQQVRAILQAQQP